MAEEKRFALFDRYYSFRLVSFMGVLQVLNMEIVALKGPFCVVRKNKRAGSPKWPKTP